MPFLRQKGKKALHSPVQALLSVSQGDLAQISTEPDPSCPEQCVFLHAMNFLKAEKFLTMLPFCLFCTSVCTALIPLPGSLRHRAFNFWRFQHVSIARHQLLTDSSMSSHLFVAAVERSASVLLSNYYCF